MPSGILADLRGRGITSVCSAHPSVIEAAVLEARDRDGAALIEATCNQVNQEGGYTGLDPAGFRDLVFSIADRAGLARERIILGGDHLGPNPWRSLPSEEAMRRAEAMVAAYTSAGFAKIHLDTSMGCADEPAALSDEVTACRAARLAVVAEASGAAPAYVVGTEVPTPGGALERIAHLEVTRPDSARETYEVHRQAFAAVGASVAFDRVIALVVQPGVEFGHANVAAYRPERAAALSAVLGDLPIVFEAHSTDYQSPDALTALVRDGFAILKVGPWLTFALREALYGLDAIATALDPDWATQSLAGAMERAMLADPRHWQSHYHGAPDELRVLRHFSYSDRIRYYWPAAGDAVSRLLRHLSRREIPETLISQYLPRLHARCTSGDISRQPPELVMESVRDVLRVYARASG